MPEGSYYQSVYNARGRGAFIVGECLATENLQSLTFGSLLSQFIRQVILGIEGSQIILSNNVDVYGEEGVIAQMKRRKAARRLPNQNLDDIGNTLWFEQLSPDILADLKIFYLRGLPEGVPLIDIIDVYAMKLANGFGVKKSRVATLTSMLRYAGSGAQAAMQESDAEPGVALHTEMLLDFYNFLIGSRPFKAIIVGTDDPKSYARAAHFKMVADAVAPLKGIFPIEQIQKFTVELGAALPEAVGPLPDAPTQPEAPVAKASTANPEVLEDGVDSCADNLQDIWLNFVKRDVPAMLADGFVTEEELNFELREIADAIYAQVRACIGDSAGGLRDVYIRNLERQARMGINNLISHPSTWTLAFSPKRPAYSIIREFETRIRMGTATLTELQHALRNLRQYVDDYANLSKSANWYALGVQSTGIVDWVRTARESCTDCINYEGTYANFQALLTRTGGRLPGNPSLQDRGHCQCYLVFR